MILINAHKLTLERFDDEAKIPPYAILSHTWREQEVSMQQFKSYSLQRGQGGSTASQEEPVGNMEGYKKIERACEKARYDEFDYIWIDTCCIDKSSSAELSEAINSMYQWYKNAAMCYALLDDISTNATLEGDCHIAATSLANARWFKRGWTLQELIAPRELLFFNKKWDYVGSKTSLLNAIHLVTRIDEEVLNQQYSPATYSIARRMSWAADRQTTRTEDIAYSLLGIFDINMPLIYGEGAKAFTRLQEELLKNSEDQSLFVWNPRPHEDLQPTGISIFASHPREFASSANIGFMIPTGEPPTISNRGVKMEVPILTMDEASNKDTAKFLMILYCSVNHSRDHLPAVPVRRLPKDGSSHTYIRHESEPFYALDYTDVYSSDARHLFLRTSAGRDAAWRLDFRDARDDQSNSESSFREARMYGSPRSTNDDGGLASAMLAQIHRIREELDQEKKRISELAATVAKMQPLQTFARPWYRGATNATSQPSTQDGL